jgi:hypothetical protein
MNKNIDKNLAKKLSQAQSNSTMGELPINKDIVENTMKERQAIFGKPGNTVVLAKDLPILENILKNKIGKKLYLFYRHITEYSIGKIFEVNNLSIDTAQHYKYNTTVDYFSLMIENLFKNHVEIDDVIGNPIYNKNALKNFWENPANKPLLDACRKDIGRSYQYPHLVMIWLYWQILPVDGKLSFVLPTNWLTMPTQRYFIKWLTSHWNVKKMRLYKNNEKQVFDINMGDMVLVMHLQKTKPYQSANKEVLWQWDYETPFIVDLTAFDIIPLYEKPIDQSILKILYLNKKGNIYKTKKTPYWIEVTNLGNRSSDKHSSNYTVNKKGTAKGRHTIYFDSKDRRDRWYKFTQTREYNFALTLIKCSGKTQGDQLDYFGLQDDSVWNLLNAKQKQRIKDWTPLVVKN